MFKISLIQFVDRLVKSLCDFFDQFFSSETVVDNSTKQTDICLTRPDFNDMLNWSKIQIDMHADTFGIKLDRRKTKIKMIEDFKNEYDNMMITKAQSESRG